MNDQEAQYEDRSALGQATQRMNTLNRMFKDIIDTLHFMNQERMKLEICINAAKIKEQQFANRKKVTVEELEKILTEDDRVKKFCPFCGSKLMTARKANVIKATIEKVIYCPNCDIPPKKIKTTDWRLMEEFVNIARGQPLFPGNTISHQGAKELCKLGLATQEKGDYILTESGRILWQLWNGSNDINMETY